MRIWKVVSKCFKQYSLPQKKVSIIYNYIYIYYYRHIHGRYPPNKNLDLFIGVPNNCEYLIGGLSFGYFPSLREWVLGGLLCAGSESIVSIGRVYMFELYIYVINVIYVICIYIYT